MHVKICKALIVTFMCYCHKYNRRSLQMYMSNLLSEKKTTSSGVLLSTDLYSLVLEGIIMFLEILGITNSHQ